MCEGARVSSPSHQAPIREPVRRRPCTKGRCTVRMPHHDGRGSWTGPSLGGRFERGTGESLSLDSPPWPNLARYTTPVCQIRARAPTRTLCNVYSVPRMQVPRYREKRADGSTVRRKLKDAGMMKTLVPFSPFSTPQPSEESSQLAIVRSHAELGLACWLLQSAGARPWFRNKYSLLGGGPASQVVAVLAGVEIAQSNSVKRRLALCRPD